MAESLPSSLVLSPLQSFKLKYSIILSNRDEINLLPLYKLAYKFRTILFIFLQHLAFGKMLTSTLVHFANWAMFSQLLTAKEFVLFRVIAIILLLTNQDLFATSRVQPLVQPTIQDLHLDQKHALMVIFFNNQRFSNIIKPGIFGS